MEYEYLMNIATILFFICYIPELYANYKNKNANIYNLPEKILVLCGTGFAFAYAYYEEDNVLIGNYAPLLSLDILAFLMRAYYVYKNNVAKTIPPEIEIVVTN